MSKLHAPAQWAATTILTVSRLWRKTTLRIVGIALALSILLPAATLAAGASSVPAPFAGTALWVTQIPAAQTGQQLVADAAVPGVRTLYVKAAEGSTLEAQFSAALRFSERQLVTVNFGLGIGPMTRTRDPSARISEIICARPFIHWLL